VSSSGTHLIVNSAGPNPAAGPSVYLGCLRNVSATAQAIGERHNRVALLGAGTKGEFREEDQLGVAWIGARLLALGFEPEDDLTRDVIERWRGAEIEVIAQGKSADYLRRSGQLHDLEFIKDHVDDLATACGYKGGELVSVETLAAMAPAPGTLEERAAQLSRHSGVRVVEATG
jgi:2-phosphosulfolactate phosphatase